MNKDKRNILLSELPIAMTILLLLLHNISLVGALLMVVAIEVGEMAYGDTRVKTFIHRLKYKEANGDNKDGTE